MSKTNPLCIQVSFNQEHHMYAGQPVITKTHAMKLPLKLIKQANGSYRVKDSDNKIQMNKLTRQFLADCTHQFGLTSQLKHLFRLVEPQLPEIVS